MAGSARGGAHDEGAGDSGSMRSSGSGLARTQSMENFSIEIYNIPSIHSFLGSISNFLYYSLANTQILFPIPEIRPSVVFVVP
jgi:hypothetical protein